MAYGNQFMGGAYHSGNYNPDLSPSVGRVQSDDARRRREAMAAFAADNTYMLPTGQLATHVMDPYGGNIRQIIKDLPEDKTWERIADQRSREELMMLQRWLEVAGPQRPPRVG